VTAAEIEQYAIRVGGGLSAFYVRCAQIGISGASSCTDSSIVWEPTPRIDDLWLCGRKERRRYPLGHGVFQIGEGPIRSLGRDCVLALGVTAPEPPSKRGRLVFGELLVDGKAVARFSASKGDWRYLDGSGRSPLLTVGPVSYLGVPETTPPGRLSRPSGVAAALG